MVSSFAWVDFSEEDRRRAEDVLQLFSERDTRDELGIGVIRDALADVLFPGTSTLHTRAAYFLLVPWTYRALADRATSTNVAARARRAELDLIAPLQSCADPRGVIGGVAGESLKRTAGSTYWAGLASWGIRRFHGSQDQYHRVFDKLHQPRTIRGELGADADDGTPLRRGVEPWDQELPPAPEGLPGTATFVLTRPQAEYLRDRIVHARPARTLLACLVQPGAPFEEESPFPWARPDAAEWPERIRSEVGHARTFSELMHGAALLYNLMLAEAVGSEAWTGEYRERFGAWASLVEARRAVFDHWSRPALWQLVSAQGAVVDAKTQSFVNSWLDLTLGTTPARIADRTDARELILAREEWLKRGRARLGNKGALARWGGSAGSAQLEFRWSRVRTVVADIQRGLRLEA